MEIIPVRPTKLGEACELHTSPSCTPRAWPIFLTWRGRMLLIKRIKRPISIVICAGFMAATVPAQEAADFFAQSCVSCHTIGSGRLTGPDLKNVTQRKEREWLIEFLQSPQAMMDKGDPYALKLQQEARGVVMPAIGGMSKDRAQALLAMVDAESKLPKSQFAGMQISDRPFTGYDIAQG